MSDSDVIFMVRAAGLGAALIAAVLLYVFTSGGEPKGFHFAPTSLAAWIGYYFRTLTLVCILAILFGRIRYIHPGLRIAGMFSALLLVISSLVFWRSDRAVCVVGFVVGIIQLLMAMLFPEIAV